MASGKPSSQWTDELRFAMTTYEEAPERLACIRLHEEHGEYDGKHGEQTLAKDTIAVESQFLESRRSVLRCSYTD